MSHEAYDALTVEQLRDSGALKWNAFPDCIGAFVAEMDFGTAPVVMAAVREALDRGQIGYLGDSLVTGLADACSNWHRDRYGWAPDPAWIQPLPDVLTGLELALRHLLPQGVKVVLPTPNYMPFLPLLRMLGHEVVQVPMRQTADSWEFDFDALEAAFSAGGGLLILCNPHNPLGRVFTRKELKQLSDIAGRHGVRVFSDEIHAPLTFAPHRHIPYASISEAAAQQAITATSASKGWNLAGLKCAQLILSNPEDLAAWRHMHPLAGHATATLGVIANTAAYRHGGAWLDSVIDYLEGNRQLLSATLAADMPGIGYTAPEGTYLAWLDCRPLKLEGPARRLFHRAGVALTDGADCGEAGTGFVRFNFALPRPILGEALACMVRAIA
ncbi:MalY/PatB family protein [Luteimonas sp. A277]